MRAGLLPLLAALALVGTACGAEHAAPACLDRPAAAVDGDYVRSTALDGDTRVVTFRDGRVFRVPRDPRRVVSTLPGITEMVAALGAADRLVAVSPYCDRPPEVLHLPRLSVMPLDRERLAELEPDLVLVDAVVRVVGLEDAHVPVLPLESRSVGHLEATVDLLAAVFDSPAARGEAARFAAALARAETAAAPPPGARTLRVLLVAQCDPLVVLGPGSLLDDALRLCGAANVACDLGRASGPFAEELVLARDPDWIVILDAASDRRLLARWGSLAAVREGRVARGSSDDLVRAGPRTPRAVTRLADVLRGRRPPEALKGGE